MVRNTDIVGELGHGEENENPMNTCCLVVFKFAYLSQVNSTVPGRQNSDSVGVCCYNPSA